MIFIVGHFYYITLLIKRKTNSLKKQRTFTIKPKMKIFSYVLNVMSRTDIKKREDIEEIYSKAKYKIFSVSAERQDGTDLLMGYLKDKTTAFAGLSGVGKSSLLSIITNGELETGSISEKISRGKHTTRRFHDRRVRSWT